MYFYVRIKILGAPNRFCQVCTVHSGIHFANNNQYSVLTIQFIWHSVMWSELVTTQGQLQIFSFLFPSEPPDVGNWFSSYVYESPTLNSSQEFGYCESKKTGSGHEIEETLENVRKTKNRGAGVQFNLFEKCNGNSTDNRQDYQPPSEVQVLSSFLTVLLTFSRMEIEPFIKG